MDIAHFDELVSDLIVPDFVSNGIIRPRVEITTRSTTKAGYAYSHETRMLSRTPVYILISSWIIIQWSDDDIIDTVLHEMAHYYCPAKVTHGSQWVGCFRRLLDANGLHHLEIDRTFPRSKSKQQEL